MANVNDVTEDLVPARRTFVSNERHVKLNADQLSECWCIGPQRARDSIKVTTQKGQRSAILPISRQYRADRMFGLKSLQAKFSTDTLYADCKSLSQNTCAQVFSTKFGFNTCYPLVGDTGELVGRTLNNFVHTWGIPEHITFDGNPNQCGRNTRQTRIRN